MFVGVDMAKAEHYAQAITTSGVEVFGRPINNDQADIEALLDTAAEHGSVAVVVDMTASGAQLLLAVAAERAVPVAYVTGLQMRRPADLYAGTAKTDPRDALMKWPTPAALAAAGRPPRKSLDCCLTTRQEHFVAAFDAYIRTRDLQ